MLFVLFQIQDDLSLCPDPGILFVCLCFHLTWLQLLFAIIIILDLHFVSDRTCCMLWTGNIQNRYIKFVCATSIQSLNLCEFTTILSTHPTFLSFSDRTIHMLPGH